MGDNTFLKEMGTRIMFRRKSLGLTQEELAEKLGVSTQMISNLELGKKAIRPENLSRLCKQLKLDADFVLNGHNASSELRTMCDKMLALNSKELDIIDNLVDYMSANK